MSDHDGLPSRSGLVYAAILTVATRMAREGVAKDRVNAQQDYRFRGIDDFYNALAPALVAARLFIVPQCLEREVVERKSGTGKALFYVTVKMVFDLTSADDGSALRVGPIYGEAMDSADKATNKAMSAAYKYAVMQAFAIPVAGQTLDGEADDETDLVPATFTAEQQAALEQLRDVAKQGLDALREAWEQQDKHTRIALAGELVALKKTADGVSNVA